MAYQEEYTRSIQDPEGFWREKASHLKWYKNPEKILTLGDEGIHHWFADGVMNAAYMALDYHVENGRGEQAALIYDSPVTDTKRTYTYRELRDQVALTAGMLAARGVGKGDRVIIYMPMIPEAAIAMLACARLGAIHSVVFGGFAPPELAVRIDDATPKAVMTASCGIEITRVIPYKPLLDEAIERAKRKPDVCFIFQRPQVTAELVEGRDLDRPEALASASPADCVPVKGSDLLYILYTSSGTTGIPTGVVRENGGHAVAMKYSMEAVFAAGERLDAPTHEWLVEKTGKPVLDHRWQTETGWGIAANLWGIEPMPVKPGSATVPVPGYQIHILDGDGHILGPNEQGNIAIKLPLPPGCLTTIWGDLERFKDGYLKTYPGYSWIPGGMPGTTSASMTNAVGASSRVIPLACATQTWILNRGLSSSLLSRQCSSIPRH